MATETAAEGVMLPDGGWQPAIGSKHRKLNRDEVFDLRQMAEKTTPTFPDKGSKPDRNGNHDNAAWEDHHPVAREVWARKGIGPKAV